MSEEARHLLLLGGGGHAAVVAESARAAGWSVTKYLDDDPGTEAAAGEIDLVRPGALGDLADLADAPERAAVHAAVGDAGSRTKWLALAAGFGLEIATVIDPSANVSPSARIGEGVFIAPRAVVNARARLGRGVIINTFAIIEHDGDVGAFSHIAPRAVLCGGVRIGEASLVGAGAIVCPGVTIGPRTTVGAGAVVTTDIEGDCTAVGAPARILDAARGQEGRRSGR
ncbi:MAG: acetyltransferase [Planctomycetota bacterium]|nr:acetyltransferase [Planctomycetota bacterium]